jgi:2-C-methyl-D-erythritol 4-phosphate cytidylyltransferase
MESTIPKQFHLLKGKPIIFHTIQKFSSTYPNIEVIVVLPENHLDLWERICKEYSFSEKVIVVKGGAERFYSVQNGLQKATGEIIGVHDAVRPFVGEDVIKKSFERAAELGAVVPVIRLNESIRQITGDKSTAVDRSAYRVVQTPQVFKKDILDEAYAQQYVETFTDDASVVEAVGHSIFLIDGNQENIKITTKSDLKIAACFMD